MCIKETLRLYPIIPMVAKLSSESVVTDGYRIPKGFITVSDKDSLFTWICVDIHLFKMYEV